MEPSSPDGESGFDTRHAYALYDEIARGGMATIRLGRKNGASGLSRVVAIKQLHAQFANDQSFMEMFRDEVQVASRVIHPNVVPILDIVMVDGQSLLVMEYVHGASAAELQKLVKGPFPVHIAATITVGVLRGLHAAHETTSDDGQALNIIHRDVTPQNVVVGVDGSPRILDFGIARANGRIQTTQSGQIKGKLAYVAPEHLQGLALDRRVDVYSSSVMLWEMLTGRHLFRSRNRQLLAQMILETPVKSPRSINPDIPPALDAIVMKGLSRRPSERFSTAREMAVSIENEVATVSATHLGDWVKQTWAEAGEARMRLIREIEVTDTPGTMLARNHPSPRETTEVTTRASAPMPVLSTGPHPRLEPSRSDRAVFRPLVLAMALLALAAVATLGSVVFRGSGVVSSRGGSATGSISPRRRPGPNLAEVRPLLTMVSATERDRPPAGGAAPLLAGHDSNPQAAPRSVASVASAAAATRRSVAGSASTSHPWAVGPSSNGVRRASGTTAKKPDLDLVKAAAATPGPAVAPTECQPPYFFDDAGIKHFKLACL